MNLRRSERTTKGIPPLKFASPTTQHVAPRPATCEIREPPLRGEHNLENLETENENLITDGTEEEAFVDAQDGTDNNAEQDGCNQVQSLTDMMSSKCTTREEDQNKWEQMSRQLIQMNESMFFMQQELENQRKQFAASERATLDRERELLARERALIERERLVIEAARRSVNNTPTNNSSENNAAACQTRFRSPGPPQEDIGNAYSTSRYQSVPNLTTENIIRGQQQMNSYYYQQPTDRVTDINASSPAKTAYSRLESTIDSPNKHGSHSETSSPTRRHEHRRLHDLPTFSGRPEEWPMFINAFESTTEAYDYSDLENLMRLQKCLSGEARITVEHVIIHPRHVQQAIRTLRSVFGRPEQLIRSQIHNARLLPPIDDDHLEQLAPFSISVQNLASVLDSNTTQNYLSDPTLLDELVSKLPMSRRLEWAKVASRLNGYPNIRDFSEWLTEVARLIHFVTLPTTVKNSYRQTTAKTTAPSKSKHVLLNVMQESDTQQQCVLCGQAHALVSCKKFLALEPNDRWTEITQRQLCFGCLQDGHILPSCIEKKKCTAEGCSLWHNELLHFDQLHERKSNRRRVDRREKPASEKAHSKDIKQPVGACTSNIKPTPTILNCREIRNEVYFRIVPVILYGRECKVQTFALLDEGSSVTLMDASIADALRLEGPVSELDIKWFGSHSTVESSRKVLLEISGTNTEDKKFMLKARTVKNLSLPTQTVDPAVVKASYAYLQTVPFPDYRNATPKLLIGLDHHHLTVPLRVEANDEQSSGIVATQTRLGWVVQGSDDHISVAPSPPTVLHVDCRHDEKDNELHNLVHDFFTTEEFGVKLPDKPIESNENIRARALLTSTTRRIGERFETGLLWRSDDIQLPNSYGMALSRLRGVESKMRRDPDYAQQYQNEIENYIKKGYARKLSDDETNQHADREWYLPHFAVQNPNKPGKFRLVFDAAAMSNGVSLNSALLSGPDENVPLARILFQFRLGIVGVCADIREMFHQVRIRTTDQHSQRFLWRNGISAAQPDVYVMEVMTFGSTCSPASAQHVKNLNAAEFEKELPTAADAIRNNHYVDDFVCSFDTTEEAIRVTRAVVDIHRRGGFVLRGFVSNDNNVIEGLGTEPISCDTIKLEPESTTEKILGMSWNTKDDVFMFQTRFPRVNPDIVSGLQRPTKRALLSVVMSVFDPFGILADFMLTAKVILQDVWRSGVNWDELIPEHVDERWQAWRNEIQRTHLCRIPRCYSQHISNPSNLQLHIFADASEVAFAAVAYWRIVFGDRVELAFVCGKSRCAPLKILSIPRLELQAAVLATRLLNEIKDSHNLKISSICIWSDSQTVLQWIRSEHRKYKPFVAYRVAEIAESTSTSWWRWCPTDLNVADDATRVQGTPKFDPASRWLTGPAWLLNDEMDWPIERTTNENQYQEETRQKFVYLITPAIVFDFARFSNYNRARRTLAWVLRFASNMRACVHGGEKRIGELTASEVDHATKIACHFVQMESFPNEYAALIGGQNIERGELFLLNPCLDDEKIIRMCGRTDLADNKYLSHDAKHPIILPRTHRFTELLVQHHHEKMGHQLTDATIAAIRSTFWVPQLRVLVRSVRQNCLVCKIRDAQPSAKMLGQLPVDRLTPFVRPFTNTGLDYFGPVEITVGRRREKRWVALFTCLATRAVHLEIAADLSTDACLVCIRNLCNLRGIPSLIRCDNGTNFVGARNELGREVDFFESDAIQRELSVRGIQWKMNCPSNPEAGGVWERLVQSVKRVLSVTLLEVAPRVETLRALLLEAANMLNSRPLTHLPVDSDDCDPITPNHFLMGGVNAAMVPGPANPEPMHTRRQWKICKELSRRFWSQWIRDYLPELTRRSKHYPETEQLKDGDLVIICDGNLPRGRWAKGRVISTIAGTDGIVRTAQVQTADGVLRRPASKLAVIMVADKNDSPNCPANGGGDVEN